MKTTTFILATMLLTTALIAIPLGDLSPTGEAAASVCLPSDDPVRDVECQLRCAPTSPEEILDPQACPL